MKIPYPRVLKVGINIVGFIMTVTIILSLFCGFRCLVQFKLPISPQLLSTLIAALSVIIGLSMRARSIRDYGTGIVLALLVGLILHILLPEMPKECCDPCVAKGSTNKAILLNLINKEAEAVLNKDISIIREIFAPDAVITDRSTGEHWNNPIEYYQQKFLNQKHYEIEHFGPNIRPLNVNNAYPFTRRAYIPDDAYISTGSQGRWSWENDNHIMTYYNRPGSDQWHFKRKNRCCCWRITRFTFNIR